MQPVDLDQAHDEARHGGKAVSLGAALRGRLPVPRGLALEVALVEALVEGSVEAVGATCHALAQLGAEAFAVRSSAVGEDSADASFAGQHTTVLGATGAASVLEAIRAVHASGRSEGALAYRRSLGIEGAPRVAVVVQPLLRPECAGVLFTRDPLTCADERVVEVSWGLGEAVVAGLVTPDRLRMRRGGEVIEHVVGDKDVEIVAQAGTTVERAVEPERANAPCLDAERIVAIEALASRIESVFEGPSDVELAFAEGVLHLLQRRRITR